MADFAKHDYSLGLRGYVTGVLQAAMTAIFCHHDKREKSYAYKLQESRAAARKPRDAASVLFC